MVLREASKSTRGSLKRERKRRANPAETKLRRTVLREAVDGRKTSHGKRQ